MLVPIGLAYLFSTGKPYTWVVGSLLVFLGILLILEARRFATMRFTPGGIEGGNLSAPIAWDSVVEATCSIDPLSGYRLWLRDRSGRVTQVRILFAASKKDILSTVREHIPPEVPLKGFSS